MSPLLAGAALGLLGAVGVLVAVFASPPMRRVRLDDRLAPYLRDAPAQSRLLIVDRAATFVGGVRRLLAPLVGDVARWLDRYAGGQNSLRRRLAILGREQSVDEFRLEQVLWGVIGVGAGVLLTGAFSLASGHVSVLSAAPLCVGAAVCGVLGRDWWLSTQVARHEQAVVSEFPVVAELLALAVTAGEGPVNAMERVCRLTGGALARQLDGALAAARSGTPLVQALQSLVDQTRIESLSRFLEGLIIAIERGTPLAEVLRAQAADVREASKRKLLEAGGRKELAMMVPIVFFVLPVTVLFALYPGLISIVSLTE